MKFVFDDGGRSLAGYKGSTGDCGVRAIAIACLLRYQEAYDLVNKFAATERKSKGKSGKSSARTGLHSATMRRLMASLGWTWTPTMLIGQGCKVHLTDGELPMGRLIVNVSKHFTAVIDGVIRDTHDPQREVHWTEPDFGQHLKVGQTRNVNGIHWISRRCVYGYYSKPL